jgi:hypothetical protein
MREYIWLSYTVRIRNESDLDIFGNDTTVGKDKILSLHFDAFKSFTIEEHRGLFDLFSHLILSDGIEKRMQQMATKLNADAAPFTPSTTVTRAMDVDVDPRNDIFVIVERSETECLLESINESGDIFVSKMDEYMITNFDRNTVLDRVKEAAGASFEHVEVLLLHLKYTREMRITSWIERESSVYEPANPLPNKIEDLLMANTPTRCLFFDSIHPRNINTETKAIHQAAHLAVEEIIINCLTH